MALQSLSSCLLALVHSTASCTRTASMRATYAVLYTVQKTVGQSFGSNRDDRPAVRESSTKEVMAARSLSRQGMVRGLAVRASKAWARARGEAPSFCLLEAGISAAPSPDRLSLCAATHSLPPCTPHFLGKGSGTVLLCHS